LTACPMTSNFRSGVLAHPVVEERFVVAPSVSSDVLEVDAIVLHSAVASARIRCCKLGTEATVCQHFNGSPKQYLEVLLQGDYVEQGTSRFDIDEEIDVAVRPGLSSGHRAKHADIARTMARRQLEDRSPVCVQRFHRHG
jgi:hypothetical protein